MLTQRIEKHKAAEGLLFCVSWLPLWGSCRRSRLRGEIAEAPPVADEARRFRGSAPVGGHDNACQPAGTTVGRESPKRRSPCIALSVTFGDSSPRGRAKSVGPAALSGPRYQGVILAVSLRGAKRRGNPFPIPRAAEDVGPYETPVDRIPVGQGPCALPQRNGSFFAKAPVGPAALSGPRPRK